MRHGATSAADLRLVPAPGPTVRWKQDHRTRRTPWSERYTPLAPPAPAQLSGQVADGLTVASASTREGLTIVADCS